MQDIAMTINAPATTDAGRFPSAAELSRVDRALSAAGLPARSGWHPVLTREEEHDGRPVTVVRFQREGEPVTMGAPHLTVVLDENDVLLGYTRLDPAAGRAKDLPGDQRAHRIATGFVGDLDPRYAAGLSVAWVDRHDEKVTTADGAEVTVSGMKVKSHHENGLYAWVIVGAGGEILTYERDIRWDSSAGRRGTQMWLHDSWIAAHDGEGAQPPWSSTMRAPNDSSRAIS
jgi:hypothetical protein